MRSIFSLSKITISQLEGFANEQLQQLRSNNSNNCDRLTIPIAPKLIRQSQHSANESNIYIDRWEPEVEIESQGSDVDDSPE